MSDKIDTTDWLKPIGHRFESQLELMRHRCAGGWCVYRDGSDGEFDLDPAQDGWDMLDPEDYIAAEPPLPEIKRHPYAPDVEPQTTEGYGHWVLADGGGICGTVLGPVRDTEHEAIEAWNALVDATVYNPPKPKTESSQMGEEANEPEVLPGPGGVVPEIVTYGGVQWWKLSETCFGAASKTRAECLADWERFRRSWTADAVAKIQEELEQYADGPMTDYREGRMYGLRFALRALGASDE